MDEGDGNLHPLHSTCRESERKGTNSSNLQSNMFPSLSSPELCAPSHDSVNELHPCMLPRPLVPAECTGPRPPCSSMTGHSRTDHNSTSSTRFQPDSLCVLLHLILPTPALCPCTNSTSVSLTCARCAATCTMFEQVDRSRPQHSGVSSNRILDVPLPARSHLPDV